MRTPAHSRAAAHRLIGALPMPLPQDEVRFADAVQAALLDSELLNTDDVGNSPAVAAATRDGLTSLAHLLDAPTGGHGAGRLLVLLLAERDGFTPYPAPDKFQLRVRQAATALLNLALWHTDHPIQLLGGALQVHAEEVRDAEGYHAPSTRAAGSVTVTAGLAPGSGELHLTVQPFEAGALSVCGRWLDQRAEDSAGGPAPACDGCFGRAPLDPAPVFTAPEHDAWTVFLAAHIGEEA
ncbi:hypothetical protein [Streptomyces sp. RKAG337]|uniref:hypothetical protein n=1 Tax=Streptomyces sp. RKAG337 TaxID=2893404 RepID=UPI0020335E84|nr:hypothetical protein [Streptomyces sp. RKAG337]MCM2430917.1 hypothetical protein [Streptomyces sp. RKAG337]